MTSEFSTDLRRVWKQTRIPVIFRSPERKPLMVKLPFSPNNQDWLKGDKRNYPHWNAQFKCWETPRAWFNDLVDQCLRRHSKLYVIQPYRPEEKCAPACWNATGHECSCSCMGANHGKGHSQGWFIVSETFAARWGEAELACRLMEVDPDHKFDS